VAAHRDFLSRFDKDGQPPERAEEESEAAYLTSRFQLARALNKVETVGTVRDALAEYTAIDAYLKKHEVTSMEAEGRAVKEMLELLPRKLSELAAKGA
jgi:hypothetical protein